jgi:hypothetical protein
VHGDEWLLSSGASTPWRSLGHVGVPFDQLRFGHFTGSQRMEIFRRAPDGQWWLISPGVFDWTPLNSSSVPLSQLHFCNFSGNGTTDVVANVNGQWSVVSGQWSMSAGGRTAWQPLNATMSDSLNNVQIADLDGKGRDDILRSVNGNWQVSAGGRTGSRPLVSSGVQFCGLFGHFDGSKGAPMLAFSWPEDMPGLATEAYRPSQIFSRTNGGFTPYGKYSY